MRDIRAFRGETRLLGSRAKRHRRGLISLHPAYLPFSLKYIKKIYLYNCVCHPEAVLLTLAEVELRHESLKREMREIRRAMRTQDNTDGLADRLAELSIECRLLYSAIKKHREMVEYLYVVEPYGGTH